VPRFHPHRFGPGQDQPADVHAPEWWAPGRADPPAGAHQAGRGAASRHAILAGRGGARAATAHHAVHPRDADHHEGGGGTVTAMLLVLGLLIPHDTLLVSVELVETRSQVTVEAVIEADSTILLPSAAVRDLL